MVFTSATARMFIAATTVSLAAMTAHAGPAKELLGKSIVITWTETREQRPVGEEAWRQVGGSQTLSIYVSDAGRLFNNVSYSTRGGSAERQGEIAGNGKRSISLNGRSLLALMPWGKGGATRITAEFDANFSSCSAAVTRAKEGAGTITRVYSGIIKRVNETRSVQVGGTSCSIRNGNAFAN